MEMEEENEIIESALRTLVEAEKIKQDKKLMAKVIELADEEKDAVKSIADLKKKYAKIVEEDKQPEEMPKKVGLKKEEDDMDKSDDGAILEKNPMEKKSWKEVKEEEKDAIE